MRVFSVDNSEWTRNGDYAPTRFSAQSEAVSYLANAKLQENQESSVGLMTMAGARIQVLISPGREPGQLRKITNTSTNERTRRNDRGANHKEGATSAGLSYQWIFAHH